MVFRAPSSAGRLKAHRQQEETNVTIASARREYELGNPFWAAGLIGELETNNVGSALDWSVCVAEAYANMRGPDAHKYHKLLAVLSSIGLDRSREQLQPMVDEIWYADDDSLTHAICHLFVAKERFLRGDDRSYKYHLLRVLKFVGEDEFCRRDSASTVFSLFEQGRQE
jgi:hypothetical protein